MLVLTGLYAVMVIITSVVGGRLSDRMGKRKPLVIVSSPIIAAASLILAFAPTWAGALSARPCWASASAATWPWTSP